MGLGGGLTGKLGKGNRSGFGMLCYWTKNVGWGSVYIFSFLSDFLQKIFFIERRSCFAQPPPPPSPPVMIDRSTQESSSQAPNPMYVSPFFISTEPPTRDLHLLIFLSTLCLISPFSFLPLSLALIFLFFFFFFGALGLTQLY